MLILSFRLNSKCIVQSRTMLLCIQSEHGSIVPIRVIVERWRHQREFDCYCSAFVPLWGMIIGERILKGARDRDSNGAVGDNLVVRYFRSANSHVFMMTKFCIPPFRTISNLNRGRSLRFTSNTAGPLLPSNVCPSLPSSFS